MRIPRLAIVACVALTLAAASGAGEGFDTKTASFAITFHDETSAYRDTAVLVLPRVAVVFNAVGGPPGDYAAATGDGTIVQQGLHQWRWTAPDRPGTYLITFDGPGKKDAIAVHAFVMVPALEVTGGLLNGYRIGEYPATRLKGKQFLCKEDTTKRFPKYALFKERLPMKLEAVLERVNAMGFTVGTLHVMSAFRTPYYNHAIGDVKYSMHQWGSAADIYIDPLKKDRMADLNRDGQVDIQDSKFLYDEIERMLATKGFARFQGGTGFYPGTSAHPPFVHVDVRGTAARWKG